MRGSQHGGAGRFAAGRPVPVCNFFRFLQKYIFDLEIYKNIPRQGRPGPGRPATGRQELICKKKSTKNCAEVPGEPAARQRGGGPWPPACGATASPPTLYKMLAAPHPLICLTKNPEKKKREGGRERQSGEALPDFQAGDCR